MSELNLSNEQRPDQWSLSQEGFTKVIKTDYFGNPYTVWIRNKPANYAELWTKFKDIMNQEQQEQGVKRSYEIVAADVDLYDERQQLDNDQWNDKIEQYHDQQLLHNELNEDI